MTKPIVTVALMMLFEEGKFRLQDPISKFMPEFQEVEVFVKEEKGKILTEKSRREITILDLFTHTSGLSYKFIEGDPIDKLYSEKMAFDKIKSLPTDKIINIISSIPLRFHPGTYFRYSWGIDVLGRLIEILSGKKLDEFLNEKIFQPLEMKDTAFYIPEEKLARFAQIYLKTEEKSLQLLNTPGINERYNEKWRFLSGGGGLTSTIKDYFNFALMFLHKGKFKAKQLLKPETIELITENHLKKSKTIHDLALNRFIVDAIQVKGYGMGLGIRVRIKESILLTPIGEHGWLGLAHTYYWVDPLNEVIGLFMTQVFSSENIFMGTVDFERVVQLAYAGLSQE